MTSQSFSRYVLADPSLLTVSGHSYEYFEPLSQYLRGRGTEVRWVGNKCMVSEILQLTDALPKFSYWYDTRPVPPGFDPALHRATGRTREEHETNTAKDFAEVDAEIKFNASDVLIVNTMRDMGLEGVLRWAESMPIDRLPYIVLIFHFTAFPDPSRMEPNEISLAYTRALQAIAASSTRHKFIFMADTDALIQEYSRYSDIPVLLAPITHSIRPHAVDHAGLVRDDGTIKIFYLGEARSSKGFGLLPWLAEGLVRRGLTEKAQLYIQSFVFDPSQLFYVKAMAGLHQDCVTFISHQLSSEEYSAMIHAADVLLIPYEKETYYVQTSGIFAEGMALGTPVVTTRGTWMAQQFKEFGGGGLLCPPGDAQGLLDAVSDIVNDLDRYRAEAKNAAERWRAFHNPQKFIDIIESHIRNAA